MTNIMVGSTILYRGIFHQVYLLWFLATPPPSPFKTWWCVLLVMLWLDYVSHWHLYQDLRRYSAVVLLKPLWVKWGNKILHNSIYIIFLRNMCNISARENTKSAISVFKEIVDHTDQELKDVDYIKHFQQHGF